jgi:hypothetical protein
MSDERLLHREQTIRAAGVLFMLAPFANLFMMVWVAQVPNKWTFPILWEFVKAGTVIQWVMQLATLIVGFMMLKGRRASWMPVLAILFVFIGHGVLTFKQQQARVGITIPIVSMLINISLFVLVYWQEYWQISQGGLQKALNNVKANAPKLPEVPKFETKFDLIGSFKKKVSEIKISSVKLPEIKLPQFPLSNPKTVVTEAPKAATEPPQLAKSEVAKPRVLEIPKPGPLVEKKEAPKTLKPVRVDDFPDIHFFDLTLLVGMAVEFEDMGLWGHLTNATRNEIIIQTVAPAPKDIDTRPVEIEIFDVAILQFQLAHLMNGLAVFKLERVLPPAAQNSNAS